MRTLICFDISDDRARAAVVKCLLDRSQRVQKSVFETPDLPLAGLLRLRSQIEGLIDPTTDSIRYYRLCRACGNRIEHVGVGPGLLEPPDTFVILG